MLRPFYAPVTPLFLALLACLHTRSSALKSAVNKSSAWTANGLKFGIWRLMMMKNLAPGRRMGSSSNLDIEKDVMMLMRMIMLNLTPGRCMGSSSAPGHWTGCHERVANTTWAIAALSIVSARLLSQISPQQVANTACASAAVAVPSTPRLNPGHKPVGCTSSRFPNRFNGL